MSIALIFIHEDICNQAYCVSLSNTVYCVGGYDPLTHGGYGAVDDYAPYPHLVSTATPDYSRNASRQDYNPDRRRDHHLGLYTHLFVHLDFTIIPTKKINIIKFSILPTNCKILKISKNVLKRGFFWCKRFGGFLGAEEVFGRYSIFRVFCRSEEWSVF